MARPFSGQLVDAAPGSCRTRDRVPVTGGDSGLSHSGSLTSTSSSDWPPCLPPGVSWSAGLPSGSQCGAVLSYSVAR